ncbi:MAG: lipoprotein [Labilithrix sp.]
MRRLFFPLAALAALAACSGAHKQPTGPAPEYEEPPAPSWLKDGKPAAAPAPVNIEPAPVPATDGGVS